MRYFLTLLSVVVAVSFSVAQVPVQLVSNSSTSTKKNLKKTKKKNKKKAKKKKERSQKTQEVFKTNFELQGGLIFLKADFEGITQDFVFDTGAPHLLVNGKKTLRKKQGYQISGIGGARSSKKISKPDFNWNGLSTERNPAFAIDMSHIEKCKGRNIGGLIGYDLVAKKEVVIDYENNWLYLLSKKDPSLFEKDDLEDKVCFRLNGHIPVIQIKMGKKVFYFGIDSGAEVNVINTSQRKRIPMELIENLTSKKVIGTHHSIEDTESFIIKSIKVGKSTYENMEFITTDLSYLQIPDELPLDGLLGYPFLKQANFSINYRTQKLYKWKNKPVSPKAQEIMVAENENK